MNIAVYKAITAVQAELCRQGITKDRKNTQQGYNFRGIDDVYNALSPIMARHGLCILPRILSRHCEERPTKSGGTMSYVTVEAEFDFVSAEDGSKHTVRTYGEAMDSADKATNKAMSAAYKYAAFQAFAIPTEGDNDADAHTPDPAPRPKAAPTDIVSTTKKKISLTKDAEGFERAKQAVLKMYTDQQIDNTQSDELLKFVESQQAALGLKQKESPI